MIEDKLEILIRQNEELRLANKYLEECNSFLNSENNYLKNLIDKLLKQNKENKEA